VIAGAAKRRQVSTSSPSALEGSGSKDRAATSLERAGKFREAVREAMAKTPKGQVTPQPVQTAVRLHVIPDR